MEKIKWKRHWDVKWNLEYLGAALLRFRLVGVMECRALNPKP